MSAYPHVASDSAIESGALRRRVRAIFSRCGMVGSDADLMAQSLVAADIRGVHSHGVMRVPEYVKKLRQGGVDPNGRPQIVRDRAAVVVVDGNNSMGQIVCDYGMSAVIERASKFGISAAGIRGSNHCGALFFCATKALAQGMIGIVASNALPTMAPWGGRDKIVGINPLAVAIPSGSEPPIVFDAAFSASSHGKIRVYRQKGVSIPDGWAFDSEGNPTTDPARAIEGLLQPIGDFKGVGLAVVMGVLSSMLSGAAFGTELGNMIDGPQPGLDGQFVMAIDVNAFEDLALFRSRVDGVVRQLRESRTAHGFDRCYAPGELEHETEQRYAHEGIPLSADTLAGLEDSERSLGIGSAWA